MIKKQTVIVILALIFGMDFTIAHEKQDLHAFLLMVHQAVKEGKPLPPMDEQSQVFQDYCQGYLKINDIVAQIKIVSKKLQKLEKEQAKNQSEQQKMWQRWREESGDKDEKRNERIEELNRQLKFLNSERDIIWKEQKNLYNLLKHEIKQDTRTFLLILHQAVKEGKPLPPMNEQSQIFQDYCQGYLKINNIVARIKAILNELQKLEKEQAKSQIKQQKMWQRWREESGDEDDKRNERVEELKTRLKFLSSERDIIWKEQKNLYKFLQYEIHLPK